MTSIRAKLIVAGLVLTGALTYLASAGIKSGWVYYMEVDKYCLDKTFQTQRVRLHGHVSAEDFRSSPGTLSASFTLVGKTQGVKVDYRGAVPDLFQADRDVVVEGKQDPATGRFQADVLLTKCASKYEAKGSPHAAGGSSTEQGS